VDIAPLEGYVRHADDRGAFLGIVSSGTWREVNFLESRAGAVRGNHYHRESEEIIFLLRGQAEVELVDARDPGRRAVVRLEGGTGVEVHPFMVHTVRYLTDCEQISLLDRSFDPDHPDLHTQA
jgi:dTDP-4-dehydrorhamnose 3,5-epimerase-like enzyme